MQLKAIVPNRSINSRSLFKRLPGRHVMIVLTLMIVVQVHASGYAQLVSLKEKNAPLKEVLKKIEKQTGFYFWYEDKLFDKARPVNVTAENLSLADVLERCFKDQPISYEIINKTILLKPKTPEPVKKAAQLADNETAAMVVADISGIVRDSAGNRLAGATIEVRGGAGRAITDASGQFIVKAAVGDVLMVSYVGYLTAEVKITSESEPTVVFMRIAPQEIQAVVVTALGIRRQEKALSYDVQQVNSDALSTVQNANFVNSLNGRVAGIQINQSSAGIGGASRVVLRGPKSISGGSNSAFYVIDGIPLVNISRGRSEGAFGGMSSTEGIADFNPEDFESVSVMSGPAAAALYGSQAAQGAIMITTKKGKKDGVRLNYSNSTTFFSPFVMPEFQDTYGNEPGSFTSWGAKMPAPTNYDPKDFFQTGQQEINSLLLSIGSGQSQTYISGAALNAKGIVPNNKYNRYNFTIRNTTSFLDDKVTTDVSGSYVFQEDQNMISQGQYFNPILATYLFPRGEDFEAVKYYERFDPSRQIPVQYWPYGNQGMAVQNPYWTTNRMLFPSNRNRYMFNGSVSYKPLSWLSFTARGRADNTYQETEQKFYASTDGVFSRPKGFYSFADVKLNNIYTDFIGTINKKFGDYSLNVNVGTSYQRVKTSAKGYQGYLMTIPNLFALQNIDLSSASVIESSFNNPNDSRFPYDASANSAVFGVAELGYKGLLYLTLSGRNDWNSRLVNTAKNNYFYPSAGISAILSDIFQMPSAISYLKLRTSYAEVATPLTQLGVTPGTVTYPITGGTVNTTGILGFGSYKPENTRSYEAGVNLKMFRNKLSLDATVYKSNTYNQLIQTQVSGTSGATTNYFQAGNVMNKGIEAIAGFNNRNDVFNYNSSLTFTLNRNKVVELAPDAKNPDGTAAPILDYVVPGTGNTGRVIQGNSIGDLYTNQVLQADSHGNIYIDQSGQFVRQNKLVRLGSTLPDYTLGWRNDFGYRNFSVGLLFFARIGGIVTSNTQAVMDAYGVSEASGKARDNGGVTINGQPFDARSFYNQVGGSDPMMIFYTYDASNVRLQEASISYKLPDHLLKNKVQLSVSLIGNNLWMIYNKAPYDPQLTPSTGTYYQGNDYFMLPSLRSMGFGIKAQF